MKTLVGNTNKWYDSAFDFYRVNRVSLKDTGTWVEYTKIKTGVSYECLQEAFLSRFKEQLQ
jgi:hypothetical protein